MRSIFLPIVFLLCFAGSIGYAQVASDTGTKSGLSVMVSESETGKPLQMATVYIVPAGDTLVKAFTFTDRKGIASLKDIAAGKYIVNVQMLGFKPYAKEITLRQRMIGTLSVSLEENLEELEGATVTEMGDLVTVKGDTLIYNATSFHTASNANLGDLLKKMPGIEVDGVG